MCNRQFGCTFPRWRLSSFPFLSDRRSQNILWEYFDHRMFSLGLLVGTLLNSPTAFLRMPLLESPYRSGCVEIRQNSTAELAPKDPKSAFLCSCAAPKSTNTPYTRFLLSLHTVWCLCDDVSDEKMMRALGALGSLTEFSLNSSYFFPVSPTLGSLQTLFPGSRIPLTWITPDKRSVRRVWKNIFSVNGPLPSACECKVFEASSQSFHRIEFTACRFFCEKKTFFGCPHRLSVAVVFQLRLWSTLFALISELCALFRYVQNRNFRILLGLQINKFKLFRPRVQ